MALMNIARDLFVQGVASGTVQVYSAPIPMAGANALHAVFNVTSLSGSTTSFEAFFQISNDGANWTSFPTIALPASLALALGVTPLTIAAGSPTAGFLNSIGAVFGRFLLKMVCGTTAQNAFVTIDVNTFNT